MMNRRVLLGAALAASAARPLAAQPAWPDRPVRVVVPYPPGGSNDIVARLLCEALRERTGQPWIVENRSGAGGNIGADAVAKATPDGTTLLLTAPGPLTINNALFATMPYVASRDFAPLALVATVPIVLMTSPGLELRDVAGLIALAKAQPGRIAFGSSGNGSTNHLAGELFRSMAGIDIVHVPYRGAAPAMTDLVAGQIGMLFDNLPAVLPQVREGRVRALAVAGEKRASALPDLPTLAEAGLPGFQAEAWFGLAGPSGMAPPLRMRVASLVTEALAEPGLQAKLEATGAEPGKLTGEAFGAFLARERDMWSRVIEASGARAG
ncbi:Tripartite-type tricarboxylate transporter, receptor component TctC [Roseomonas rosea]|uniref:Tripartite-type tricarboxylate transporter, receptor component TctC n=1 Tax=Muricoccus roseus TaxID=198092 RepID=A0A1M6P171_9PROT|nr:tripartite tricarboxylate transporter substrate binding protein [Roseomonas rosea]SHK01650.1 Tripartite-type tricarboxylate transporter, receptor component TctC [Roseomonas rosea]